MTACQSSASRLCFLQPGRQQTDPSTVLICRLYLSFLLLCSPALLRQDGVFPKHPSEQITPPHPQAIHPWSPKSGLVA